MIEHRRVMREDMKIKNISIYCVTSVKCLIADLDKFNDVENKIFDMYLPKLCHNSTFSLIMKKTRIIYLRIHRGSLLKLLSTVFQNCPRKQKTRFWKGKLIEKRTTKIPLK